MLSIVITRVFDSLGVLPYKDIKRLHCVMKTKYLYLLLALALFFAEHLRAEQQAIGSWSVGINLGYGQRTAFILEQDDLQFYVLPDISYYGEKVFFDNGTLGYTFSETQQFAFSAITEFNPYGLYFEDTPLGESFGHLYFISSGAAPESDPSFSDTQNQEQIISSDNDNFFELTTGYEKSVTKIVKPKLSLDIGLQLNWFFESQFVSVKLLKDMTIGNDSARIRLQWFQHFNMSQWSLNIGLGVDWLNSSATNYYFGVTNDYEDSELETSLGSSVNPFASLTISYPITSHFQLVGHFKYLQFADEVKHSSVLSENHTFTRFVGFNYRF